VREYNNESPHCLNFLYRCNIKEDLKHVKSAPIYIGEDVLIGMNCQILKGVLWEQDLLEQEMLSRLTYPQIA
jgi:acetyltransferase-like isoleucine patch superfamily enzyme